MRVLFVLLGWVLVVSVAGQTVFPTISRFPSLSVRAGSRAMGMGDHGISLSEGTESLLYNPAIAAFTHYQDQLSFSYMPWLSGVSNDVRMMRSGYVHSLSETSAMGLNLSYLDLGQIDLRDDNGATLASFRAKDYHLGVSYALLFAEQHSLSVSMKFLGQNQLGMNATNLYSFCGDVGYYGFIKLGPANQKLSFGAVVSNLGTRNYLPTTAGIGFGFSTASESGDVFSFGIDASRLVREDWKSIRVTAGGEYGISGSFFLRGGFSLENREKGNRKFFSLGAGYKGYVNDQRWEVDIHYLLPFGASGGVSAFQHAYGISLGISMGNFQ